MIGTIFKDKNIAMTQIFELFSHMPQFKHYFVEKVGKGKFQSTDCEQISVPDLDDEPEEDDQEQFQLVQQDEATPFLGINTFQFNSGMFAPSQKQERPIITKMPQFFINNICRNVYGYNSKYNAVSVLKEQYLCFGSGNILILCKIGKTQKLQNFQKFLGHNNQITSILFDEEENFLYTGSSCCENRAQIIKWSLQIGKNGADLTQNHRFYMPRKTKGVGSIQKIRNNLLCIDQFSLHNNNSIYIYDTDNKESHRHKGEPIKINSKVMNYRMTSNNEGIILVTNNGIQKIQNILEKSDKKNVMNESKFTCICRHSFISQSADNFLCGTSDGYLWESTTKTALGQIHKGWILQLLLIEIQKKVYLISSGGDDKKVKIFTLNQKVLAQEISKGNIQSQKDEKKTKYYELVNEILLSSYTTTLKIYKRHDQAQLLIGCRDGSIAIYSFSKKKLIINQKMINGHEICNQKYYFSFEPIYNKLTDCIFIPISDNSGNFKSLGLLNAKSEESSFHNIISNVELQFNCICFSINENDLLYVLNAKKIQNEEIFPVILRTVSQFIQKKKSAKANQQSKMMDIMPRKKKSSKIQQSQWIKFADQLSFDSEKDLELINLKLDSEKYGKPCIARYDAGIIMLGTSLGHLVIHDIKANKTIISSEHHQTRIQDIAWQKDAKKQFGFYKSVSKGELFYWNVEEKEGQRILGKRDNKSLNQLKKAKWSHLVKYCWETKYLWETMNHYDDISNIRILNMEYLLVSMADGNLRIYNYPLDKKNKNIFLKFKLFNSKFQIISCQGRVFHCFWKGVIARFQL